MTINHRTIKHEHTNGNGNNNSSKLTSTNLAKKDSPSLSKSQYPHSHSSSVNAPNFHSHSSLPLPSIHQLPLPLPAQQFSFLTRMRLYLYLAPNALLVLTNDILALYTLSFVNVSTYAIFMQISIVFIVIIRYLCLKIRISYSQMIAVLLSISGMILFKLIDIHDQSSNDSEPEPEPGSGSSSDPDSSRSQMIGILLCMLRGVIKACDLVYVEWFTHELQELSFFEKQMIVSSWFVICSVTYSCVHHFDEIFVEQRPLFTGFGLITWLFISYGVLFAIMIYLLILRLDSMIMAFCQQITVLFAVLMDVILFQTKVTFAMWIAAIIVVLAITQYNIINYERSQQYLSESGEKDRNNRTETNTDSNEFRDQSADNNNMSKLEMSSIQHETELHPLRMD